MKSNINNYRPDSKLEIYQTIKKMKREKLVFENSYEEGNELFEVKESLNNRLLSIKKQLTENPENQNLNIEFTILTEEIERIDEKLAEFQKNHDTQEGKIEQYQNLIEYNLKDLYTYTEFLETLEADPLVTEAIKESLESLDLHLAMLKKII